MDIFLLGIIIVLVLFYILYTTFKMKKIYDEVLDYESPNEEVHKKIEKLLKLHGFYYVGIKKYEYTYLINSQKQKVFLPKIRIVEKGIKKYGLLINEESLKIKDNEKLKKQILEYAHCSEINGCIVFNNKDFSYEVIEYTSKKIVKKINFILVLIVIGLIILRIMNY